jgi:hypothetical protein
MAKRGPKKADKHYDDGSDAEYTAKWFPGEQPYESVLIHFVNGHDIRVKVSDLSDNMRKAAVCHGLIQKIGDSYASLPGLSESIEEAESVAELLLAGEWTKEREGGPRLTDLFEAIRRVKKSAGQPVPSDDDLRAKYTGGDGEKKRAAARANPQVAAALVDIAAEKIETKRQETRAAADAATTVDVTDL